MIREMPVLKDSLVDESLPAGQLRILGSRQLEDVFKLHAEVMKGLPDLSLYIPYSRQEMKDYLNCRDGFVLGFYVRDQLAAFRVTAWPGEKPHNLGYYLQMPPRQLKKVIQLEGANVLPPYRGNGLQQLLTEKAIDYLLLPEGEVPVLMSVSPYNGKSLSNMMGWGMKILAIKDVSSSMVRLILRKTINAKGSAAPSGWKNCRWIPADDVESQRNYLKVDFQGFQIKRDMHGMLQICYGQPE